VFLSPRFLTFFVTSVPEVTELNDVLSSCVTGATSLKNIVGGDSKLRFAVFRDDDLVGAFTFNLKVTG
jgi:hypothetical protein